MPEPTRGKSPAGADGGGWGVRRVGEDFWGWAAQYPCPQLGRRHESHGGDRGRGWMGRGGACASAIQPLCLPATGKFPSDLVPENNRMAWARVGGRGGVCLRVCLCVSVCVTHCKIGSSGGGGREGRGAHWSSTALSRCSAVLRCACSAAPCCRPSSSSSSAASMRRSRTATASRSSQRSTWPSWRSW